MSLKPTLHTSLSPSLLHLYEISNSVVVIIDVLRATSTIATALYNGAEKVIPVEKVSDCIQIGLQPGIITAGERDGKVAEGLQYGNSPFEYPRSFIEGKILALTTTNGTRLLHLAASMNASEILTGSFANLDAVCRHLVLKNQPVILACAAWKDKVNIEDTLFAGAVAHQLCHHFEIACDATQMAMTMYKEAKGDMFQFMKEKNASHYKRLMGFGLERDIRHCLTPDTAPVLPLFQNESLVNILN